MGKPREIMELEQAEQAVESVLCDIQILQTKHAKVLNEYDQATAKRDEAIVAFKEAQKAAITRYPDREGLRMKESQWFTSEATTARAVDIPVLELIIDKKVTSVKGLADVKVTVKVGKLESLVGAGVVTHKALGAITKSRISVKFREKES